MLERTVSRSIGEFLFYMQKKKFAQSLHVFIEGGVDDEFEICKILSSYLTHAFIEVQQSGSPLDTVVHLKIPVITELLNQFIGGNFSVSDLRTALQGELR